MNANQIHIGTEYAVAPYGKPNGNAFVPGATRFVAYRIFGEQEPHNTRLTMYVEGFRLDKETGDPISTNYVKFRVRDVIEDWEEYQDRADQHEVEQEKIRAEQDRLRREREERWKREREEQDRLRLQREREREARERETRNRVARVLDGLRERGLNMDHVSVDQYNGKASITLEELDRWLKSLEKVECMTCHRDLIMIPMGVNV